MAFPCVLNTSYVLLKIISSVMQLHCGFKVCSSPPTQGIKLHIFNPLGPWKGGVLCLAQSAVKGQVSCQVRFLPSAAASGGVTWLKVLLGEPQLVAHTHLSFWLLCLALQTRDAFLITQQKVTECQKTEFLSEKPWCES